MILSMAPLVRRVAAKIDESPIQRRKRSEKNSAWGLVGLFDFAISPSTHLAGMSMRRASTRQQILGIIDIQPGRLTLGPELRRGERTDVGRR
jgi:hypothetical protein